MPYVNPERVQMSGCSAPSRCGFEVHNGVQFETGGILCSRRVGVGEVKSILGLVQVERRGERQAIELGNRVRARRLELELSQEDLGEASGLHRTYTGHVERGEINLSLLNILKLAAAMDLDAGELVEGLAQTLRDPRTA